MELYSYQEEAVDKLVALRGCGGLFMEMGTGKTRTALRIAQLLEAERICVVAPLAARPIWRDEVKLVWPEMRTLNLTKGSIVERAQRLSDAAQHADAFIAVVGYESYWRQPLRKALLAWDPHFVIYDEAHRLKGRTTKQARFAHHLAEKVSHRLGLTGTPSPNGLQDMFSVFKALKPSLFGTRWPDFESMYLIMGGYQGYQIIGYRNEDGASEIIQDNSFRITKADALDLPEQVDVRIPIALSPKETNAYEEMKKHAIAEVQDAMTGKYGTALARIVLTSAIRLQQITSGYVKVEDGSLVKLGTSKIDTLRDLLEDVLAQTSHVVVFCRFTHDVEAIADAVAKIKKSVYVLDGRVLPEVRENEIKNFQDYGGVLVGQIQVSSLAIDLSCAHTAIFYSPDYSLTNYLQARDRLHRIGQTHHVTYYSLVAEGTVDTKLYRVLEKKENLMRKLHNDPMELLT